MPEYEIDILMDGKYRIVAEKDMKNFQCLRYEEKWRDLTGDNMVAALCHHIQELEEQLNGKTSS